IVKPEQLCPGNFCRCGGMDDLPYSVDDRFCLCRRDIKVDTRSSAFHLFCYIGLDEHGSNLDLLFNVKIESIGPNTNGNLRDTFILAQIFNIDFKGSPEKYNNKRPHKCLQQRCQCFEQLYNLIEGHMHAPIT